MQYVELRQDLQLNEYYGGYRIVRNMLNKPYVRVKFFASNNCKFSSRDNGSVYTYEMSVASQFKVGDYIFPLNDRGLQAYYYKNNDRFMISHINDDGTIMLSNGILIRIPILWGIDHNLEVGKNGILERIGDDFRMENGDILKAEEIEVKVLCAICGEEVDNDKLNIASDVNGYLCESCYNECSRCDDCGEMFYYTDDLRINDTQTICEYCWSNNDYVECDECGCFTADSEYDEEDERHYCQSCFDKTHIIKGYHYSHSIIPEFHKVGDSDIFMGIELEMECNGDTPNTCARYMVDKLPITPEHDGSLDNGFEAVFEPMNYEYIYSIKDTIKETFSNLIAMDCRGDRTNTCGLHIHISREPLREDTIDKIIIFLETYKNEVQNFARRSGSHWCQWYSEYLKVDDKLAKSLKYYKDNKGKIQDRYMCLNLQNRNTIEFRIFKSTLNYDTFMATIDFVHNLVEYCNSDKPITKLCFNDLITTDFMKKYCDLRGISNSNKIVINDNEYNRYLRLKEFENERFWKEFEKLYDTLRKDFKKNYDDFFLNNNEDSDILCGNFLNDLRNLQTIICSKPRYNKIDDVCSSLRYAIYTDTVNNILKNLFSKYGRRF